MANDFFNLAIKGKECSGQKDFVARNLFRRKSRSVGAKSGESTFNGKT